MRGHVDVMIYGLKMRGNVKPLGLVLGLGLSIRMISLFLSVSQRCRRHLKASAVEVVFVIRNRQILSHC